MLACHRSLVATGNRLIAAGRLTDILRRVAAFGLVLAPLDVRQEASRHTEAIAWIARVWNLGSFEEASEDERVSMLLREIANTTRTLGDLRSTNEASRHRCATSSTPSARHRRCRPSRSAPT